MTAIPVTDLFQEVEVPRFRDNRHMKVLRLSALYTGRLYPPSPQEIYLVIVWPEGLSQQKIPMTPSGIEPATIRLVVRAPLYIL